MSPLQGHQCIAYDYEVYRFNAAAANGGSHGRKWPTDFWGYARIPCEVKTPRGDVRLVGLGLLEHYPEVDLGRGSATGSAGRYLGEASWVEFRHRIKGTVERRNLARKLGPVQETRHDARRHGAQLTAKHYFRERVVPMRQVCAVGQFSAEHRALVSTGETPTLLLPGEPDLAVRLLARSGGSSSPSPFSSSL